jgi:hypothetical protein
MACWGFAWSGWAKAATVSTVLAGLAVAVLPSGHALAGSGDPAYTLFKKSSKSNSDAAPVHQNWNSTDSGGKSTTETAVVNGDASAPFVAADSPAQMEAVLKHYEEIVSSGGWPTVPSARYKKGAQNKGVAALNQRLRVEGYLPADTAANLDTYTDATFNAVAQFQRNHGLAVTGIVDRPTLASLNVPAASRLATLKANLPRLVEYSKDLGSRYVVVNVPAMQLETVSNGAVYSRHNAIVGRPSRPTPVVMTPLTIVRFNPYWNAPPSIVERDILPSMISSNPAKVMEKMNMKIFKGVGGPEIDPRSVNWRRVVVDDYHFRQEPGGSNAMATAKIEFNSPFGIYLHDTPEPELFARGQRFYSSGCVRVEKVAILINWILQGQDGIDASRISELAETKERLDVNIKDAPQIRVAYLTAWPSRGGVAAFRPDVYELDGTGFVVGQPLPVGESAGGQRFVLKPIPRSPQAVDEDEASGFAALFFSRNRNSNKVDVDQMRLTSKKKDDTLIGSTKTATKTSKADVKKQTASAAKKKKPVKPGQDTAQGKTTTKSDADTKTASNAKKKVTTAKAKSKDEATKTADAKKAAAKCKPGADGKLPKDCATAAAKKPADKAKAAAAVPAKCKTGADGKPAKDCPATAAKKPADPSASKAKTASADAGSCKPGADGKLPTGCAAAAKTPVAKAETQAAAAN